jgi:hypothetical protein
MKFQSLSIVAAVALALSAGAAQAATENGFANSGFEVGPTGSTPPPGGSGFFAANWLFAPTGNPVLLSSDQAYTGSQSALLTVPNGFGGSTLFQNSFDHGQLGPLTDDYVGNTPMLTFWAKGDVSTTGNILFSLRYLAENGAILVNSGNIFFQNSLSSTDWNQISFQGAAIPAGTRAVFLEINTAVGPLLDGRPNAVFIDDVYLGLSPIPEPGTYGMLLAGLGVVGAMARRRRAA